MNGTMGTHVSHAPGVEGYRTITSDDFCAFSMRCDRGLTVSVTLNAHLPHHYSQELLLIGDRGRLAIRGSELYGQTHTEPRERLLVRGDDVAGKTPPDLDSLISVPSQFIHGTERSIEVLRNAFESAPARLQVDLQQVEDSATFEDGMYVYAVVEAITDSSRTGRWQDVTLAAEVGERNPFWTSSGGGDAERSSPMPPRSVVTPIRIQ